LVRQLRQYHTRCGKVLNDLSNYRAGYQETDGLLFFRPRIVLHNTVGPAVIYPSGYKAFWIHGLRHRIDGPAIKYSSGKELYYLFNKRYSKKEYYIIVKKIIESYAVEYLLSDNPNIRSCAEETVKKLKIRNRTAKRKIKQ
jgi:hypothetical protein